MSNLYFLNSTFDFLEEFKEKHSRIIVHHQENKGVSFTSNQLISLPNGDYILFLDADDSIPLKTIENLISNSKDGKADIIVGRAKEI